MKGQNGKEEKYYEAVFSVPRAIHEPICDFIIDNYSKGVILEEEEDSPEVGIRFYVPYSRGLSFKEELSRYIGRADSHGGFSPDMIRTKVIANVEWEQAYKDSIKPIRVEDVIIKPPWEKGQFTSRIEIIIEPKMAFGTGSHETTQLCIKEILKHFKAGQTMFDLGCGSGILSILAAKLGAERVTGVDIDLVAVQNSGENIVINGVDEKVKIQFGSIEKAAGEKFDFFAANLIKSTIIELMAAMLEAVRPGGILLLSGLLLQDKPAMSELLSQFHLEKTEINQDGQWLAYTIHL
ncbi:putative Ribosomal protein L11 methyltransferase [Candidatus Zixiibacteriota bacterium]|nr:putative Ribosomal protein L11 methyltransferase [candidate division Zixibacteria bacterium]